MVPSPSTACLHNPAVRAHRQPGLWARFKAWLAPRQPPSDERRRALSLVAAIDAGGLPLNPARVNQIARDLGLEVSRKAPVEHTVARIRAALERCDR
jgi:hypothetical protein